MNLSDQTIPIFVIVKDRLECLRKSVDSWINCFHTPIKIIFIDQESTYKPTINYLKHQKYVIWNRQPVNPETNLTDNKHFWLNWPQIINSELDKIKPRPDYYVLSDPDIMFDKCPGNILEIYAELLNIKRAHCVGPEFDLSDIPKENIMRGLITGNQAHFQHCDVTCKICGEKEVKFKWSHIDTTFAMYRSNRPYIRDPNKDAIRVCWPYNAKHLDFYLDYQNLSPDHLYYLKTSFTHGGISHFGTVWLVRETMNVIRRKVKDMEHRKQLGWGYDKVPEDQFKLLEHCQILWNTLQKK